MVYQSAWRKVFWIEFAFSSFETSVEKVQTNAIILCVFARIFLFQSDQQYQSEK